jgi:hypothetical protein
MKPMDNRTAGNLNLLLLADLLDGADEEHKAKGEPAYDQTRWFHTRNRGQPCHTPACAIGHWLTYHHYKGWGVSGEHIARLKLDFDIDSDGWNYLFGYCGNYAKSAREEAERLRAFVAARALADVPVVVT